MNPLILVSILILSLVTYANAENLGSGYALNYDGIDDVVNCGPTLTGEILDNVTVEAWFAADAHYEQSCIFYDGSDGEFHLKIWRPRNLAFHVKLIDQNWYGIGMEDSLDASWHYAAGVYNSELDRVYLYLDDTFIDSTDVPDLPLVDPYWADFWPTIGAYMWDTNSYWMFFHGTIDEVRVWNVARTKDELYENMHRHLNGNEEGLIGYWRMDEGSGQFAFDLSPFENHGELGYTPNEDEGDPVWVTSGAGLSVIELNFNQDDFIFDILVDSMYTTGFTLTNHSDSSRYVFPQCVSQWVSFYPESLFLEPDESEEVVVTCDAGDLSVGSYATEITFLAGDPWLEEQQISVEMNVFPLMDVEVVIDDDVVNRGDTLSVNITITNPADKYVFTWITLSVKLPCGMHYGPLFGPYRLLIPAYGMISGRVKHLVPYYAPPGISLYLVDLATRRTFETIMGVGEDEFEVLPPGLRSQTTRPSVESDWEILSNQFQKENSLKE